MDTDTRDALIQLLGKAMSDVSEEAYCAGWGGGTEFFVPELCRRALATRTVQKWGHGVVTPEMALGLTHLANEIGAWANLADDAQGYVEHHPFPVPVEYVEAIEREQSK